MPKLKCSLPGCNYETHAGQGLAAHERAHKLRGEATGAKGNLIPTGVPIVTKPYERKLRMDAVKGGQVKAEVRLPSKKHQTAAPNALAKRDRPTAQVQLQAATIDVSQLTPDQVRDLQQQFGRISTRDRLMEAAVFASVSDMLDEQPPEVVLTMLSQLRRLPLIRK